MMKYLMALVVVVIVGIGAFWVINNRSQPAESQPVINTTPTPTAATSTYCQPAQLSATIDPEVAAGNYYGAIKITNTSSSDCQVAGNNQLEIGYPMSVTNFKTDVKTTSMTEVFTLTPNQTIYALIHFPNGPQCSSQAVDVNAMVSYQVSPAETVTFQPIQGTTVDIPSCGKESEITMIDLYAFSDQQVLPN